MTNRNELIAKAVLSNLTFSFLGTGTFGVQELYAGRLNEGSLRKMGELIEAQTKEKTSSRFSTAHKTKAQADNELRLDVIEDVLTMMVEAKAAAKAEKEAKADKAEKVATLKMLIAQAEINELENIASGEGGKAALEKMLAELQA